MLKLSKRREAILNAFRASKTHPTAIEIFDIIRREIPGTTLATIYRNIHALEQENFLRTVNVGDGSVHYDAIIEPHCHITCMRCGCVEDVSIELSDDMITQAQQECDYTDVECHITFTGLCSQCKALDSKS